MPSSRQFHALSHQGSEFHGQARRGFLLRGHPRFQNLFDRVQQPLGVVQHQFIEFAPLRFFHRAPLQRLQVEADGCDRRF